MCWSSLLPWAAEATTTGLLGRSRSGRPSQLPRGGYVGVEGQIGAGSGSPERAVGETIPGPVWQLEQWFARTSRVRDLDSIQMKSRLPPRPSVRAETQGVEERYSSARDLLVEHAVEPDVEDGAEVPPGG